MIAGRWKINSVAKQNEMLIFNFDVLNYEL